MTGLVQRMRDQRGSATIEFAIASLFLFGVLMVGLDFGVYAQQNLRLGNAVQQGAVLAFNNRAAGSVDTNMIGNYVAAAAGGPPAMTYLCNGSACTTTPTAKCIAAPAASGGWPTFTDPSGSGTSATCGDGSVPGQYLVIRATRTYQPVIVPDRYLNGKTMQQQVVVRLS